MNLQEIRVAFFLFVRYIRGSNKWTTSLILFVMLLTFLNLVVINGLLEGIVVGSLEGTRTKALGDIFITAKEGKPFIDRTQYLISDLDADSRIKAFSARYAAGDVRVVEKSEYYNVTDANNEQEFIQTTVLGVNPEDEKRTTHLDASIIEGQYLAGNDRGGVLIGRALLERYSPFGEGVFGEVYPGDPVYIAFSGSKYQQYTVRGVFRTKAGELDLAIIMNKADIRLSRENPGNDSNFIAIRLHTSADAPVVKQHLITLGYERYADIETVEEAIGPFLNDIRITFKTLGTVVGAIGLIVASITIFIIIFVTATSRRRFIGILKGIGVASNAIRLSYVFYALFFSVIGTFLGLLLLFFLLVPYFQANPLDFPFSDGVLYFTTETLTFRMFLIFIATLIAGFVPAYYIVRKPAIEAIMGR